MIRPTKFGIVCDGCGEVYPKTFNGLRGDVGMLIINDMHDRGWTEAVEWEPHSIKHYCPKCRKDKGL